MGFAQVSPGLLVPIPALGEGRKVNLYLFSIPKGKFSTLLWPKQMGKGWWTSFTSAIAKIFKDLPQQLLWHMPMSTKRSCPGLGSPTQWAVVIEGVTSEGQLRLHNGITCEPLKKANRPSLWDTASVCLMWTFRHLFSSGYCFNILFFNDEIF